MHALVTGATGFMGKKLVEALEDSGMVIHKCNTKIGNLEKYENILEFNAEKFDYIFHLAAHTKAGDWCLHNPSEQWITNQIINTNIIKYWSEHQPQAKLIAMGTSCSYDPKLPLSEEYYEQGSPEDGLYYYAETKRMLLTGLRAVEKQHGCKWLYLVPSTLYGSGYSKDDTHFIFDLVRKIQSAAVNDTEVVLWGDGHQKRELIHIDDFIKLAISALPIDGEVINVGRGKEYTIREYADIICDIVNYDCTKIIYDESKYVGVRSKKLDTSKIQRTSPNFKYTPLKEGLKQLVDWEISNA